MRLSNTISGSFHVRTKGGSQDPGNVSLMTVTFCGVLDRGHAGSLVLPQTKQGQASSLISSQHSEPDGYTDDPQGVVGR